jgi:hypothetical protein
MDLTRKRLERGYCPRPTNPQPRRREGDQVLEREIDGKLQIIAAMRLFRFSQLIQPSADSLQFEAVAYESFEAGCKALDPVCGRLIRWIGFSAGAEFFAKGVCLLRDIEVRRIQDGVINFGTLGDLNGKKGQKGKLWNLCQSAQASAEERQTITSAYKKLAAIRNRDAHAYIPNVRTDHFEVVSTSIVPCLNLLTSWLPYGVEDFCRWSDEAPQFIAALSDSENH